MGKQKPPTLSLRLPPTSIADLDAIKGALVAQGYGKRNEDIVGALLHRARAAVAHPKGIDRIGADARAQRSRATSQGY